MSAENRDRAALLEEIQRLRLRLVTLEQDAGEQAPDDLCCVSLALRHAPCGAIVSSTTIDGTIQYVNAEFTAITGYELSDIPTVAAWTDLAYPDPSYRTRVLANWHQDIGEPGRDVVYTVCCKDGSQKEIQLRAASLPNERMVVTLLDVSQHEHALEAVRASEERFRQIAETIDQVFWVVQPQPERILYVSPAFEIIWGRSSREIYHDPRVWIDGIHPEDRPAVADAYENCLAGHEPGFLQLYRVVRPDGETRWVEDAGYALEDEQGDIYRMVGTAKDVTDEIRASRALRESDERFRQLADTLPSGLVVHCHGRIVYANRAAAKTAGAVHPRALIGRDIFASVHPDSQEVTQTRIAGISDKSTDAGWIESTFQRQDGTAFPAEVASTRIDWKGEPAGLVVFNDISERRQAEEDRLKLERRIQEAQRTESLAVLAGGVAHDFNNLLVGILGNADLALLDLPPDSPARTNMEGVELAARRAADLARQMLAYSGKGQFVVDELDLHVLLRESSNLLDASISKKVAIEYHLAEADLSVRGDATQIRQVIMNLITNAAEAIGDKSGVISISTGLRECDAASLASFHAAPEAQPGAYAYIEIRDTGAGMSEATRRRIFDPFFTTKFTGRGLGLAAVQGIVRGHGGAIHVESQARRGSTFRILLPALEQQEKPVAAAAQPEPLSNDADNGTVLIVDDDENVLLVGSAMLTHAGYQVLTAADGRTALEVFRSQPEAIDCVLLDLSMPRMDGRECYRRLCSIAPNVRVVLSSGYNEKDAVDRFAGEGLAGFIQKPYRSQDLFEVIRQACSEERIWE